MEHRNKNKDSDTKQKPGFKMTRRDALKGLATTPVLGIFAWDFYKKRALAKVKKEAITAELNLPQKAPAVISAENLNKQKLKLGIIGTGSRGMHHLRCLGFAGEEWFGRMKREKRKTSLASFMNQQDLNIEISGICDVFDLRAEEAMQVISSGYKPNGQRLDLPAPKRHRTYRALLDDKNIDAVLIATPDFHHAQMTVDAALAGKHVYAEKGLTRTEEEVYRVYDAVKKSGISYQLGHQNRQNDAYKIAKEAIGKNILGKITLVETTTNRNTAHGAWVRHLDSNGNPKPGNPETIDWDEWLGQSPKVPFDIDRYYNWSKWFTYATGLSGQLFSHEYDAINQVIGMGIPQSVMASGGIYFHKDNREIPDTFQIICEYPDHEMTLLYSATLQNSRGRGKVLMGHDASMELGRDILVTANRDSTRYKNKIKTGIIEPGKALYKFPESESGIDAVTSATEKYYAQRGLLYTEKGGKTIDLAHLHLQEWLNAIRDGGETSCNMDVAFDEGITIQMATKSYLEKRRVEWDAVNRKIV